MAPSALALLLLAAAAPATASAPIAWSSLKNPILAFPDAAVKDVAVRRGPAGWQLLFSYVEDRPFRFRVGHLARADLAELARAERPDALWDDATLGGLASPDVALLADGRMAISYNSHTRDLSGQAPKLYARTCDGLGACGPAVSLGAPSFGAPGERLIDAALHDTGRGLLLAFKRGQRARLAFSPFGRLEGPWLDLGAPHLEGTPLAMAENFQLLKIDGRLHLLATTLWGHTPTLYELRTTPSRPEHHLRWRKVATLDVPREAWNRKERANAAYLVDSRGEDGFFYLFYAGSDELRAFRGRGHAKLGVARSRDLERWEVPPGDAAGRDGPTIEPDGVLPSGRSAPTARAALPGSTPPPLADLAPRAPDL
jgi:hypothetical protein